jgi:hypothetical protein
VVGLGHQRRARGQRVKYIQSGQVDVPYVADVDGRPGRVVIQLAEPAESIPGDLVTQTLRDGGAIRRAAHAEPGDVPCRVLGHAALAHAVEPGFDKPTVAHIDHCVREPPAQQHSFDMRRRSRHLHQAVISWHRLGDRLRLIKSHAGQSPPLPSRCDFALVHPAGGQHSPKDRWPQPWNCCGRRAYGAAAGRG